MNASDLEHFLHFTRNNSETDSQQIWSCLCYSNFYLNHVVIHSEDIRMPKFIAKVQTPLPEEIIPVDPLPERCFYEKHAINLKLWKNTLPAFVDR